MTLLGDPLTDAAPDLTVIAATPVGGHLRYSRGDRSIDLHPNWLRDQSREPGQIEPTNLQRLFTPRDIPADIAVTAARVGAGVVTIEFSDGHVVHLAVDLLERLIGWADDPERPPAPEPWTAPLDPFPYVSWDRIGWHDGDVDDEAVIEGLAAFFRAGYVVFRDVPTEEGAVVRVAERMGYVTSTNFGRMFDVRVEPRPVDLAYTPFALLAHADLPYRRPVPGIQLLHCLRNEAPGGDSTLVDGLAASIALRAAEPEMHRALAETEVEFRYDIGADVVVSRGQVLVYDRSGNYRGINFNTKTDTPILRDGLDLDAWYEGRRWLTHWLNDPAHQVTFRLEPGDVMFMDNHRALHGRTAFDPSKGVRHLQGCYIEHDGPDTMHRLAVRRHRAALAKLSG